MSRQRALAVLVALFVGAGALIGLEIANGAADAGTLAVQDPCGSREAFPGEGLDATLQRIVLDGLDGAACELGTTREELVLSLAPSSGVVIEWDDETQGVKFTELEIPSELRVEAERHREALIEAAAEGDESLLKKYLETGTLSEEEIKRGIRARCLKTEVTPVTCGSAFKNKGVQAMLDAVVDYLPAPSDVPPIQGLLENGSDGERPAVSRIVACSMVSR